MRFNLKKTLAGAAAIAVVASVAPFLGSSAASAATPGSPGAGVANVNPTSGTSLTPAQVVLPAGAACPGDTAADFWAVNSFIVPAAADLNATLTFNSNGSPAAVAGSTPRLSLFSTTGTAIRNLSTDLKVPPALGGQISGVPFFNFTVNAPGTFPDGAYKIGLACALGQGTPGQQVTYWSKTITIDYQPGTSATNGPGELTWVQGASAAAPTLTAATAGDGQITAAFTPGSSDPAVPAGGFTAIATPPSGPAISATGSGSPIVIPGLANGTTYSVTVTANNGVGSPTTSNALTATPSLNAAPPVLLTATNGTGQVTFNWTYNTPGNQPPAGTTLSGYDVTIGGVTTTVGAGVNTFTQAGPAGVAITATVTPLFSAPAGQLGTPASATGTPLAAQVLNQVITVIRPAGQLVLTQVCGAKGPLDAEGPQLAFPTGLPAETAANTGFNPTTDGGVAPNLSQAGVSLTFPGANPDVPANAAGPTDGQFSGYPYPDNPTTGEATPTYPTWCGIELGAARFVRTGAPVYGQGQYYAASGRLNQVTVVDTRDSDPGWNIAASVTDFTDGTKSFSANQLGWTPRVDRDTGPFTDSLGNTYNQTTAAGPGVAQNTFLSGNGLGNPPANTLINAAGRSAGTPVAGDPNQVTSFTGGLGIAVADARLKLAIPVTALSGNYTAVMTISAL